MKQQGVEEEKNKLLSSVITYASVDPWTVVVELKHTPIADGTVLKSYGRSLRGISQA